MDYILDHKAKLNKFQSTDWIGFMIKIKLKINLKTVPRKLTIVSRIICFYFVKLSSIYSK